MLTTIGALFKAPLQLAFPKLFEHSVGLAVGVSDTQIRIILCLK